MRAAAKRWPLLIGIMACLVYPGSCKTLQNIIISVIIIIILTTHSHFRSNNYLTLFTFRTGGRAIVQIV